MCDEAAKRRLRDEILEGYLRDNVKARILRPDGLYERAPKTGAAFSVQDALMKLAMERMAEPATRSASAAAKETVAQSSPTSV